MIMVLPVWLWVQPLCIIHHSNQIFAEKPQILTESDKYSVAKSGTSNFFAKDFFHSFELHLAVEIKNFCKCFDFISLFEIACFWTKRNSQDVYHNIIILDSNDPAQPLHSTATSGLLTTTTLFLNYTQLQN